MDCVESPKSVDDRSNAFEVADTDIVVDTDTGEDVYDRVIDVCSEDREMRRREWGRAGGTGDM